MVCFPRVQGHISFLLQLSSLNKWICSWGFCKLPCRRDLIYLQKYLISNKHSWVFSLWKAGTHQVVCLEACELNMTLGTLSADWQGYIPVLLVVWQGISNTETCQQLYEQASWCWYEYFWEHMHWLIFPSPGNLCQSCPVTALPLWTPKPDLSLGTQVSIICRKNKRK